MASENVALRIMQEAVGVLAKWTNVSLPQLQSLEPQEQQAVKKAKSHLKWPEKQEPQPLRLLFDFVDFSKDGKEKTEQKNYCPVGAIKDTYPSIPYPKMEEPTTAELENLKLEIQKNIAHLIQTDPNWFKNLSLLTVILEKYGSCLSFGESDIALIDLARSTAAVAAALAENPEDDQITLIAGDLSGIQKFIYTISSDGALKSLRARSFYLELVAEEIVQQLLEKLHLPRTSVIYAGGGNLYLLAPAVGINDKITEIKNRFNKWLLDKFKGQIFLALANHCFPAEDVSSEKFAKIHWQKAISLVNQQKTRKFDNQIQEILDKKDSYPPCKVCHRDDFKPEQLKPLNENESVLACPICNQMFELGERLFGVKTILRSHSKEKEINSDYYIPLQFSKIDSTCQDVYYHLFKEVQPKYQTKETIFRVNDWKIENYRNSNNAIFLLLGNYGQRIKITDESRLDKSRFIRAEEMASCADGIKRVGYLRMDVDNLGKIFAKGLKKKTIQNLPRIAGLSRLMTYFFKVHLNQLAKDRHKYFFDKLQTVTGLTDEHRNNLLFIYAGGDDLFISGTWNEVVEFAFDVYQAFRAYTGYNPDITLSGGISLADVKFPLYQAANESGEAENKAKGNGRDSLGLFGEVFKWNEWLGTYKSEVIDEEIRTYLSSESLPSLFGILPFVKKLYDVDSNYSRSFVRNLLATAQVQKQMIKEIEEKRKNRDYQDQERDIRYYLHLPKIAYTLARLPKNVLDNEDFRKSLKSPYNAPYFQGIATWIELLNRKESHDSNND
ncbi:type III-A CRISPR-associated protein Cas10/Csm1 [Aerosakkonemataceae cyanobacterium BLCC-F154]|uniref:CRISPR system single-strand-specific deoxyribonuclease Cas10/Csm1 (subtype III-A) n=1 Tax=Floridaenema fluviatile BLCC-F154 TaxID=3153640 RepID=A0ABV4Y8Y7_9CYAN